MFSRINLPVTFPSLCAKITLFPCSWQPLRIFCDFDNKHSHLILVLICTFMMISDVDSFFLSYIRNICLLWKNDFVVSLLLVTDFCLLLSCMGCGVVG